MTDQFLIEIVHEKEEVLVEEEHGWGEISGRTTAKNHVCEREVRALLANRAMDIIKQSAMRQS